MLVHGSGPGVGGAVPDVFHMLLRPVSPRIDHNRLARQGVGIRFSGTLLVYLCILSRLLIHLNYISRFPAHAALRKRRYRPIFHSTLLSISASLLLLLLHRCGGSWLQFWRRWCRSARVPYVITVRIASDRLQSIGSSGGRNSAFSYAPHLFMHIIKTTDMF